MSRPRLAEPVQASHKRCPPEELQGTEPVKEILVLLPGRDGANWRRIGDLFKGVSFHFEICPGINLSCLDINVTEEISNHVERNSALQHVHPFCVSKSMRTHRPIQTWNVALRLGEILLKNITNSRPGQALVACIREERLVKLFGAIEMVFL